jgi:hypothetical protein
MKIKLSIILLFLVTVYAFADSTDYGLSFNSYNEIKEKRTSLCLTSDKTFQQNDYFSIEFKVRFSKEKQSFGYVLRIIQGKKTSFDLVLNNPVNANRNLYFISGDDIYFSFNPNTNAFDNENWNTVKIEFLTKANKIKFILNGKENDFAYKLNLGSKIDVYFGANEDTKFTTHDVPPMVVKDVLIYKEPKTIKYEWKLEKHEETKVYDEKTGLAAYVKNPNWIIDSRTKWHKENTISFDSKAYAVYDGKETIYFISKAILFKYSIQNNTYSAKSFTPHLATDSISCQFIFDAKQNVIKYYDFENKIVSNYDFANNKWNTPINKSQQLKYQHHNSFISPIDSSLVQLFGYGFHLYNSELLKCSKNKEWFSQSLDSKIPPRYLSAISVVDSTLFVYGGVGNKTGKQEQGICVYNDLYKIDLKNYSVKKIWDRPVEEDGEVAARNLIFNKEKSVFYALCYTPSKYKTHLLLKEFGLTNTESKIFGDSIPFFFQDTESFVDLILCKSTSKLLTITIHKAQDGKYEANIFSLSYPPLQLSDVSQPLHLTIRNYWWEIVLLIVFISGFIVFLIVYKRKRKRVNSENDLTMDEAPLFNDLFDKKNKIQKEGIYLLGGFQVINKECVDITGEFTPVMKLLLISIILYTFKNGKGISNTKIKDLIWPDKSEESARNNRSVNVSKLRLLLSTLTDFEISNDNSYWTIELGENAYCDYIQSLSLLESLQKNPNVTVEQILYLLQVISSGELLPNIQIDWADNFKAEYSNNVIDVLLEFKNHKNFVVDPRIQIAIADAILILDTLNEEAIKLKCLTLIKLGRVKISKTVFDSFNKEYTNIMGEELSSSFEQFIKE